MERKNTCRGKQTFTVYNYPEGKYQYLTLLKINECVWCFQCEQFWKMFCNINNLYLNVLYHFIFIFSLYRMTQISLEIWCCKYDYLLLACNIQLLNISSEDVLAIDYWFCGWFYYEPHAFFPQGPPIWADGQWYPGAEGCRGFHWKLWPPADLRCWCHDLWAAIVWRLLFETGLSAGMSSGASCHWLPQSGGKQPVLILISISSVIKWNVY